MRLQILYQDKYVVAVIKPSGMLSVPGRGEDKQDCVISRMMQIIPDAKVVHRLDCYTSGLMLLAIGENSQRELSRQFHDREIQKKYVAIVHGVVTEKEGVIDMPLRLDVDNRPVHIVDYENGKSAETHWKVIESLGDRTRLQLRPITGRTHQLRVHCKELGYPIAGDRLYGLGVDTNAEEMYLHAETLEFSHPDTGSYMRLTAPCEF